ncbi:MAG: hypothetical protein A2351_07025 [Omnitrophica bacterium RIFOXYB12_FULL_50_7]|nr:MAG: hypothetical protein A2351_07025 [Omnitrophica bacterium RIFOXYB12_FULL_50_7]
MMKKKLGFLLVLSLVFSQTLSFGAVTMQDLRLPKDFYSSKSPYAQIVSVQENRQFPGFLTFSVTSPHGHYLVRGLTNLRKCLHEIDVIEQLNASEDTGSGIAAGAVDSVKDTGTGLKNLAVHPVDSVTGIGKGIGKLGGKIGGMFREKEKGEKGDGFLSSTKRQLAKKLGVDVYSRNPDLQARLDSMAKARMGGRGIVTVATFFVPVGLIASAVVTVSTINTAADQLVDDNDRADLFNLNKKALLGLGFSQEKVTRLLNHPYYTPRELTYLRFYLEKLKRVQGFEALLDKAIQAVSDIPADKILHEAQIAADSIGDAPRAMKLVVIPEGLVLANEDKVALIAAYDFLDNSILGSQLTEKAISFRQSLGKRSAEIWNGGAVTSGFGGTILLKGIKVQRMCLFESTGSGTPSEI